MGRWLYTIKDRKTGKVLFTGGEGASARFLDCEPAYMTSLARRDTKTEKRTVYGNMVVTREWVEASVQCQQCGITIKNVNLNTKYCKVCAHWRKRQRTDEGISIQGLSEECVSMRIQEKQRRMQEPCHGCIYFGGENYMNATCNYLFVVGHSRGCPPGAECTQKKEGHQ